MFQNKLADLSILITGASSGIGRAAALRIGPFCRKVCVVARREERLKELKGQLQAANPRLEVQYVAGDVRDSKVVAQMAAAGFFSVDVFVNNAGLALGFDNIAEARIEDWDTMLDTNCRSAFILVQKVLPFMLEQKKGHIINVASIAGHYSYEKGSVYCATKHALLAFSRALRSEVCGEGIRVGCVSPGMVETEFSLVRFAQDEQKAGRTYAGMVPLSAEDIAEQILFMLQQPPHVNIDEILLTPVAQAFVSKVVRDAQTLANP